MKTADWLPLAAIIVGAVGLGLNWYAIRAGNKNASAATLIALNGDFRQSWERFLSEVDPRQKEYLFADLLNILEVGCALYFKRTFVGVSKELLSEYLTDVMRLIDEDEYAARQIVPLVHSKETFKYIEKYLGRLKKQGTARVSVTVPNI